MSDWINYNFDVLVNLLKHHGDRRALHDGSVLSDLRNFVDDESIRQKIKSPSINPTEQFNHYLGETERQLAELGILEEPFFVLEPHRATVKTDYHFLENCRSYWKQKPDGVSLDRPGRSDESSVTIRPRYIDRFRVLHDRLSRFNWKAGRSFFRVTQSGDALGFINQMNTHGNNWAFFKNRKFQGSITVGPRGNQPVSETRLYDRVRSVTDKPPEDPRSNNENDTTDLSSYLPANEPFQSIFGLTDR